MKKKDITFVDEFTEVLVDEGLVTQHDAPIIKQTFHDADADQFDDFLLDQGLIQADQLLHALARYYQVPYFDVQGHFFNHHLLREFPKDFLIRNGIIPLEDDESTMVMVASNPADPELLPAIGKFVSYDIQFQVGLYRFICDAVEEYYDKSITEGVEPNLYDNPELEEEEKEKVDLEISENNEDFIPYQQDEDEDED